MPETLAIKSDFERFDEWIESFAHSDLIIVNWDDIEDASDIDYALVWKPETGALAKMPNLKIIFSIGAGLDHLKGDNILPPGIPVVRMVEQGLTNGMVEYVVYNTLRFHRFMPEYEQQQVKREWHGILQVPASQRTVGILGLGELGKSCADALVALGFSVSGWSRSEKQHPGVRCYFGDDQLDSMLSQTDILVCLLPLTEQTQGILNRQLLSKLPPGSYLINAGRGLLQVENDLLDLANDGQLQGLALDVFEVEPLAENSELWNHPKISITPHVASMTLPASSAIHVYDNITRYRKNESLTHVFDNDRGY